MFSGIFQSYSVSTTPPDTPLLGENRNISFTCLADPSSQQPNAEETISWEFQPSSGGGASPVMAEAGRVTIEDRTLTIHSLRETDSGTYVCVASHPLVESVHTPISLTVEGREGGRGRRRERGEGGRGGEEEGGRGGGICGCNQQVKMVASVLQLRFL